MGETKLPFLFTNLPEVFAAAFDPASPWTLLTETLPGVLDSLPSEAIEIAMPPDAHILGDRIVIGAGTRIQPGAVIEGPIWIGRNATIRPGAYLRGGNWIGDDCLVGANSEVKRAILLAGSKAPHQNYVGDSILGCGVNLGAGTILSNFRHDGASISISHGDDTLDVGTRKLGAILGDEVLTGCNSVLHPGVIVGQGTQIYPGVQLRSGVYPAASIVKLRQQIEIVAKRT